MLVDVNWYNDQMRKRGQPTWNGGPVGQNSASGPVQGKPLPGGGCGYQLPNGNSTNRLDVNCDGTPTTAALAARKNGGHGPSDQHGAPGGRPMDPHGNKVRNLMGQGPGATGGPAAPYGSTVYQAQSKPGTPYGRLTDQERAWWSNHIAKQKQHGSLLGANPWGKHPLYPKGK
jgi:hypothetical protein